MRNTVRQKRVKKARVIPGFRCTFGIVVLMLSLIVLIPLASVLVYSLKISPGEFFSLLWKSNVRNAFLTSIGCSLVAAGINTVFGVIVAWTLVKYDFPGKRIVDGLIELPFCTADSRSRNYTFQIIFGNRIFWENVSGYWN